MDTNNKALTDQELLRRYLDRCWNYIIGVLVIALTFSVFFVALHR